MSVQKYLINKESNNFTIIPNKIIKGLVNNLELLGFYLHLLSLPPNWSFHKTQLQKECNVGIKKLEKFLKLLVAHNLISIAQNRDSKGKFTFFDLTVYNGDNFKIIDLQELSTPCVKNRPTDNGSTVKNTYKRKIIQKKEIKRESTARKRREPLSDDFVFDDENQKLCQEKRLDPKFVLDKFKAHSKVTSRKEADWQVAAKLWIIREQPFNIAPHTSKQEIKSTVMEYGPGHLRWEELHGKNGIMTKEATHGSGIYRNRARC
jgi:hypothetical protein